MLQSVKKYKPVNISLDAKTPTTQRPLASTPPHTLRLCWATYSIFFFAYPLSLTTYFSFFLFLPPVFFFSIQTNLAQTLINLAQCSVSTKCGLAATLIPQCGALCLTRLPDYVSDLLDNPDCWIELCLYINNHRYVVIITCYYNTQHFVTLCVVGFFGGCKWRLKWSARMIVTAPAPVPWN